jgi:hypothetical protein
MDYVPVGHSDIRRIIRSTDRFFEKMDGSQDPSSLTANLFALRILSDFWAVYALAHIAAATYSLISFEEALIQ